MSSGSVAALPMRHTLRIIRDPDAFGDAVSGAMLRVEFQRRQERPSRVEQFQTPAWALDFGEAHVKTSVHGVLPGGWASMCLVRGPAEATWNGVPASQGTLCCVPPGEVLDGRTAPGFSWMTVALPPEVWAQSRAVAGLDDHEFHRFAGYELPPARFAQFERQLSDVYRQLREASAPLAGAFATRAAASLTTHLAVTACEFAAHGPAPRDSLRNRARLARRAEAWMRDRLAESIGVADVCLAMHVSRRELEYAFRLVFDLGPREFLHKLRLHAIRRALLRPQPGDTILRVLLDHGITHPGRFAADYRALFGQRPSETFLG